jgi:hypothetical protein
MSSKQRVTMIRILFGFLEVDRIPELQKIEIASRSQIVEETSKTADSQ